MIKILPVHLKREGFVQNSVINKPTNIEILITELQEGREVYSHKHNEDQIGYCFSGEFNFYIDKKIKFHMKEKCSYHISGNLSHKAFVEKTIYALDLKFKNKNKNSMCKKNIFTHTKNNIYFNIKTLNYSNFIMEVYTDITIKNLITKNLNPSNEYYIVCHNEFLVTVDNNIKNINKFNILHISNSKFLSLSTKYELNSFIIIEIIHIKGKLI